MGTHALQSGHGGRAPVLSGTVQDVTQRRNLEESMRMANLIYQTSSEAVVVTDEANRIVDANPAFTAQTGYTLDEVLGSEPQLFGSSMHDRGFYARPAAGAGGPRPLAGRDPGPQQGRLASRPSSSTSA
jgi:PAS domain-containing protein